MRLLFQVVLVFVIQLLKIPEMVILFVYSFISIAVCMLMT